MEAKPFENRTNLSGFGMLKPFGGHFVSRHSKTGQIRLVFGSPLFYNEHPNTGLLVSGGEKVQFLNGPLEHFVQ
jgi:hypothetical protein